MITGPFKDKTINTSIFTEKVNLCNKVIATKVIMKLRKTVLKRDLFLMLRQKKKKKTRVGECSRDEGNLPEKVEKSI